MSETARRVLIVEDESIVALDLQSLLLRLDYVVCGRESTGEGAVEAARREEPDLVLMDISLAGEMDGITAAESIRRELDIPIIFLTAYADKTTVERAKASDAYGYLLKPFQEREIEIAIDLALVKHSSQRQVRSQQALLDATLESIPDAVVTLDGEGRILYLNDPATALLGGEGDSLLGQEFERVAGLRALPEQENRPGPRVAFDMPSGETRLLEVHRSDAEDSGEGRRTVLLLRDVTLQAEYEQTLETARNAAEEASRAKSEFLANMSHELKTPMNSILGMSELSLDLAEREDQREYLSILRRAAEELFDLITNLLDFSRLEAGTARRSVTDFRLDELIEETAQRQLPIARRKEITLLCVIDPAIPAELTGEREALASVLTNLLSNGVKFTREGEVRLEAKLLEEHSDTARVLFEVRDTGIGMPKDASERLFQAFTQADPSATRGYGGTGIGLALVQRLVDSLGGTISLESEQGAGTTFSVVVTLRRSRETGADTLQEPLAEPPEVVVWDNLPPQGEKILPWFSAWGVPVELGGTVDSLITRRNDRRVYLLLGRESFISEQEQLLGLIADRGVNGVLLVGESEGIVLPSGVYPLGPMPRLRHLKRIIARGETGEPDSGARALDILVVDDQGISRVATGRVLEALGHNVRTVSSGKEALQTLGERMAEVVFLDLEMPELNGWETTGRIRKELQGGEDCAIIAVTGHSGDADRERAKRSGMDDFVTKPVQGATLDQVARRALTRRSYAKRMQSRQHSDSGTSTAPGGAGAGQPATSVARDRDASQTLLAARRALEEERFGDAETLLARLRDILAQGSERDASFRALLACRRQEREEALSRLESISVGGTDS